MVNYRVNITSQLPEKSPTINEGSVMDERYRILPLSGYFTGVITNEQAVKLPVTGTAYLDWSRNKSIKEAV